MVGNFWHRYVIFDMKHAAATPSFIGQQLFYNPYINSFDYHVRLVPKDLGPNLAEIADILRSELQPNPRDSEFMKAQVTGSYNEGIPRAFAEENFLSLSTDEYINRTFEKPNWEYYLMMGNIDDRVMLGAAWEIARAHPGLVARYSIRNLYHFIFDPGYAHTRFNLSPFSSTGLNFLPSIGDVPMADADFVSLRASREARLDPLAQLPKFLPQNLCPIRKQMEGQLSGCASY